MKIFLLIVFALFVLAAGITAEFNEDPVAKLITKKPNTAPQENALRRRRQTMNPTESGGFTNVFGVPGQLNSGTRGSNNSNRVISPVRSTARPQGSSGPINNPSSREQECIRNCVTVQNSNPVCGTDNVTYMNEQRFNCAVRCGRNITVQYYAVCSAPPAN